MKQMKRIAVAALAAAALTATLGAVSASATTLEVGGVTQNESITISTSLKAGTSMNLRDTFGFSTNTCTSSAGFGNTQSPYTGATMTGVGTSMSIGNCSDPVTAHKTGTLHISYTSGTNGTVTSSGAEVTADGPFGYLNCRTGEGTHLGTLTGAVSGQATMDINAVLDCGISARMIATYAITSLTGLGVSA